MESLLYPISFIGDVIDSDDDASSVDSFDGSMPLSPPPEQSNRKSIGMVW